MNAYVLELLPAQKSIIMSPALLDSRTRFFIHDRFFGSEFYTFFPALGVPLSPHSTSTFGIHGVLLITFANHECRDGISLPALWSSISSELSHIRPVLQKLMALSDTDARIKSLRQGSQLYTTELFVQMRA